MNDEKKTTEERIAALERIVAELPRRGRWQCTYERDIIDTALQCARVRRLGFYLERDGKRIPVHRDEADTMHGYFTKKLVALGEDLLREMSIEEPPQ